MRFDSLLDSLGRTPLVGLPRLSPSPTYASGPSSRTATPPARSRTAPRSAMIEQAEKEGLLTPGCTILEPTSGNTGISLAMVAKLRGYEMVCVMPENTSPERRQLLRDVGRARSSPRPAAGGSNEAVRVAKALAEEHPDWVMLYQYGNEANAPRALRDAPAPSCSRTCPTVTHFVAGLGTTGTLMGVGRYLREQVPDVADRRRRAALRRAGVRAAQHRRGLRPRAVRRVGADHAVLGDVRGRPAAHPRAARAGGHLRRHLDRRAPARRAGHGGARRSRRASAPTSPSSSPTAAGSTCRPARTSGTLTRRRSASRASSGPERRLRARSHPPAALEPRRGRAARYSATSNVPDRAGRDRAHRAAGTRTCG